MTAKKFFLFLILQLLLLLGIKLLFFKAFGITDVFMEYAYWALIAVVVVAMARRLGVMNYLEAIFVAVTWFLANLFFDLIITGALLGYSMFTRWQLWVGYLIMMLSIFVFHKKRHVQIRKEQAAHHHGHH